MLVGFFFFIFTLQKGSALIKTNEFMSLVDRRDYTTAYNEWLSDNYKNNLTLLDFDLNMSLYSGLLGKIDERKLSDYTTRQNYLSGKTFITLKFDSSFEKDANAEEVITLRNDYWQQSWEIDSYRLISDQAIKY